MITRAQIDEHWDHILHAVKDRWPGISGEELEEARGSAGHFVGVIQQRTGEERDAIEHFLSSTVCPVQTLLKRTSMRLSSSPLSAVGTACGIGFVTGLVVAHFALSSD